MLNTIVLAGMASLAYASPFPQGGVTALISASGASPSGCAANVDGVFGIVAIPTDAGLGIHKRYLKARQVSQINEYKILSLI